MDEFEKKKAEFLEKYKALIDEYQLDFASFPVLVPNAQGVFEIRINTDVIDTAHRPIKSPFI